jgi:hypothetical protein
VFLSALTGGLLAAPLTAEARQLCSPGFGRWTSRSPSALVHEKMKLMEAVDQAIRNLTPIFRRNPGEPVEAEVFNMLLARAKDLFPESKLIARCLKPLPRDFCASDMTNLFQALSGGMFLGMQDKAAAAAARANFLRTFPGASAAISNRQSEPATRPV